MDTKRRHFERHKAGTMQEDDDLNDAAACADIIRPISSGQRGACQSLVTSKIGLFERLSNGSGARLSRQPELDEALRVDGVEFCADDENEEEEEEICDEEEEEEFLVLDTIVEEDEETATCESAQVLTSTTTSRANDKLDCDRLAELTANINNNVPATGECGNFAANSQMTPAANENNGRRASNSKLAPSTIPPSGCATQQPPAEERPTQSQSSPSPLPSSSSSSSSSASPSPSSSPLGNHKAQSGDQQVGEAAGGRHDELEDSVEFDSIRLMTESMTTDTTTSATMTTSGAAPQSEPTDGAHLERQLQETVKSSKTKTAANKMQYQTLLPSTNRLISEHQARQHQALFRALNERQKILDELGAGEQLERPDLMSTSSISLNLRSKRHWRKSAARSAAVGARRRSNSASHQEQADGPRRRTRRADRSDGGVPLSSVDLSSMTDQQVDEILGQIAPASSSSSLVSSRASLLDEFSSSSSSAASSSGDDFSSSTYSTDDDEDDDDEGGDQHELSQDQLKSQMVRRIRRRLAADSDQLANCEREHAESTGGRQQQRQGLAPSVIGVHEDDAISVNSARRSLRSSARNCRETFKKRGKNGPSDDENDHDGDQQGDLFVSVAASSGRADQQSGGLGPAGSNQCSLSPLASQSQSQTTAAGGGGGGNNLLLASAVRNFATTNSHNSLSSSSVALSQSQSPTTSDEHSSLPNHRGHRPEAHSVEATLSRMLKALDEVGQNQSQHDEQDELAELLERGFLHLEQLLECSQTPGGQTLARSQQLQQQAPSQKDSDYGSDTQSNGECLSSSVSQSASGAAAATQTSSSSLSPLAVELSLRLAELLRRLAQQQQQLARRQPVAQLEASTSATPELDVVRGDDEAASQRPESQQEQPRQPPAQAASTPRARMRSVVMINSGGSQSSGNVTPCELLTSRPESQQSQRQFKTRVNIISSPSSCEPPQASASTPSAACSETQIIKLVAAGGPIQSPGERVSRRGSFLGSSLRRRPSFSGSIASVHREPGAPRPGSPVPRSVLEMQAARAAKSASESNQAEQQHEQQQQQQQQQQQHRVQRALILAQKYNYSPAKLATSKLSAKLNLKELIATGNNYADGNQLGGSSSANRSGGDLDLVQGKSVPPNRIGVQAKHTRDRDPTRGTAALDVTGQVQLDISYFARTGSLTVHLLQCSGLAPVNKRRATSNPYVKLYLLPDRSRSGKRKSSVKRRQLNPNFGERFTFGPLQLHEFESRTLWLSVWHKDRGLGRNVSLGELHLPLSQIRKQLLTSDLCQSTSSRWYQLKVQERQLSDQALLIRQADGTPLTTKKLPLSGETTDTIKRLSDFEKRAARLAQQDNRLFTDTNKPNQEQPPLVNRLKANSTTESIGRLVTGLQLNMDGPGQSPLKTMQVGLGPVQTNSNASECAAISGQLFVALKFVPESAEALAKRTSAQVSGSLHVLIKEARDIGGFKTGAAPPPDQLPSPFCRCILLDSTGQKLAKQKTQQLRRTNSPSWNQTLIFPKLKMTTLQAQGVEIQLFNRDSILVSSSEHMGSIRLCRRIKDATETASSLNQRCEIDQTINMASVSSSGSLKSSISSTSTGTLNTADDDLCSEREARLWGQMLARPNIWVYGELPLRQLCPLVDLTTAISRQQTNCSIDNK